MKYRVRHLAEYAVLRAIAAIFGALPYHAALALACAFAWVAHRVFRFRAAAARARIREVFGPGLPEREVRRIAWVSFRNLFFNAVELVRTARITPAWVERHVDVRSFVERAERHIEPGRGAIFVVPHMGNWDLAGVVTALRGHPLFVMAARQRNPLTDAYLNRLRGATGIEVVFRDDDGALRHVLKNLKHGKRLAILTDLRSRTPGMRVRFLGKDANIVAGLGLFARQADVVVCPGCIRRVGWTRHTFDFEDPIRPDPALDKEADWQRITQRVMDVYERAIRAHPDQYFWYNKRWVLDPLGKEEKPARVSGAG